ncbi:uncharacterized protein LOC128386097 isoform X1 [Panonychus citri]|uniref:uncharacterized protein LOC128386097 isoform X1 n=1 Tax=Panonychus citri TaxID=50023 RepID=UPI0023079EB2|nr:uncharacterized protein LOC128386097 isoform X1 [Panonychus citri]
MFKLSHLIFFVFIFNSMSSLREQDFRDSISGFYPPPFTYQLRSYQVQRRIDFLVGITDKLQLTDEERLFTNVTVQSLRMLSDLMNTSSPLLSSLNRKMYDDLSQEYETVVNRFNQQITNRIPLNIDELTPEKLSNQLLQSKITSQVFLLTKRKALLLIEAYKGELEFLTGKHSNPLSFKARIAKYCLDGLDSLYDEIENVPFSETWSVQTLVTLLHRFELILKIISSGP